ncbi:DUF192 domain-containing protein [Sulfitobacter pseudonitzschiae]|nr:DUF192 domain-containing protein [Pseudosulfitobacter pseudonitzschiae]MBM1814435.1 DUF192 domain-containing protein [Pseudosulfitobacter pseudonitzschiae]MBM1831428.1 DUF192 domain-containing protein [Pseudosulfitobacter pseudonitzschiae]MBM1836295.1 DUF192 domain-containing protein [Pseudosulfitobacter pseudonitzschiae]MBM1841141.1 DUF192 domain-containing protein [Pseudosulfitobacter pseudonitzschiae]MBM1846009.1 DUF192 domain-containing protein [Pseudosulfitobacter pseudonitzschiae]
MLGNSALWAACSQGAVDLRGDWGQARFNVEIADDNEERAQGLMNRPKMPQSAGMLFVYESPRPMNFWMRNTLIPLDMIFIDAQGVVQNIHHRAIPLDETPIFGGDNLLAALEINGGLAERMGITEGTQVRHPAFDGDDAAWPCTE